MPKWTEKNIVPLSRDKQKEQRINQTDPLQERQMQLRISKTVNTWCLIAQVIDEPRLNDSVRPRML